MNNIRVKMTPPLASFEKSESGIKRVIEAYHKHAKDHGITYVSEGEDYDVLAIHAGTHMPKDEEKGKPIVAHIHGLYWTADYDASAWEWRANANVIETMRLAEVITVPSNWVAESVRRDMRVEPLVIPHGINTDEWKHDLPYSKYVLWNKNRDGDVCSTYHLGELARRADEVEFISTFADPHNRKNIHVIGLQSHEEMRELIIRAGVYLSTTKETFGIGILEAMAAGTPVLGFDYGGNSEIVEHGISGYLAQPYDYEDLARGLKYCIENRESLSYYASKGAEQFKWRDAMIKVRASYGMALERWNRRMSPPYTIPEEEYTYELFANRVYHLTSPFPLFVPQDKNMREDAADILRERYLHNAEISTSISHLFGNKFRDKVVKPYDYRRAGESISMDYFNGIVDFGDLAE